MHFELAFRNGAREDASPVMGNEREQLMDSLHGKHYQDALAGRVFSQTPTPLGLAIPIYTATDLLAGSPVLWNPPNSGVRVELISYQAERASGVTAFSAIGLMARRLDAIATGAAMTALAEVTPINGNLLIGGAASKVRSSAGTGQTTVSAGAAADFVRSMFAISPVIDTTAVDEAPKKHDFDGTVIVPPGVFVYIAGTKASVALYAQTLVWKEIPL